MRPNIISTEHSIRAPGATPRTILRQLRLCYSVKAQRRLKYFMFRLHHYLRIYEPSIKSFKRIIQFVRTPSKHELSPAKRHEYARPSGAYQINNIQGSEMSKPFCSVAPRPSNHQPNSWLFLSISSVRRRNCTTESLERTWPSARASELTNKKRARDSPIVDVKRSCRLLPTTCPVTSRTHVYVHCTATYLPTTILFDPAFSARTLDLPMKFKTIFDNIPALT